MFVYMTTNLIDGKIYIGQQSHSAKYYLGSGRLLRLAIRKWGKHSFKKEILQFCFTHDELNIYEKYWIKVFNSTNRNIGYNLREGGDANGGYIDVRGEKNPMYGKRGLQKVSRT